MTNLDVVSLVLDVVDLGCVIALSVFVVRKFGPQRQRMTLDQLVDEGIALAENAGRLAEKTGTKLTSLDKRREAVAHAAHQARRLKLKATDAELAKLVEVRLSTANRPAPQQVHALAVEVKEPKRAAEDWEKYAKKP